jgi:mRNA-degrading endonuclease RelE of RelBE toxin-antitoxin system
MAYKLIFTPEALQDIKRLDKESAKRVNSKIERLAEQVKNINHFALTGQWSGFIACG